MHRKFLGLSWSSLQDRRQFLLGLLGCNSRFKPSDKIQELVASDTHPPEIRLYLCPNICLSKESGHWRHHTDDGLVRPIQVEKQLNNMRSIAELRGRETVRDD